jgi:hypothetical protein
MGSGKHTRGILHKGIIAHAMLKSPGLTADFEYDKTRFKGKASKCFHFGPMLTNLLNLRLPGVTAAWGTGG